MDTFTRAVEHELDRLAAAHESPAAFEALCWCLWQARRGEGCNDAAGSEVAQVRKERP